MSSWEWRASKSCDRLTVRWWSSEYSAIMADIRWGAAAGVLDTDRWRRRLRLPSPQVDEQSPQSIQSDQVQYSSSWHLRGQLPVSSSANSSQFLPPWAGYWTTWRKRFLWPPHLPQAPQSCQSPCLQSLGEVPGQTSLPHSSTSESGSSQAMPPCRGISAISRERLRSPPPQVAEHWPQLVQVLSLQSTAAACAQPSGACSPGCGLQGQVSFKAPMQYLPEPWPYLPMRRERRMTPLQEAEQSLQGPQSVNSQSTGSPHATSTLQKRVSRSLPSAGFPHSVAMVAMRRVRKATPPPHVLEQGDQSTHASHSPSSQAALAQACVLHGETCSFSSAWQGLPPPLGAFAMCRVLDAWPPPQEQLQALQLDQAPQAQSSRAQRGFPGQAAISHRAARQPTPPASLLRRRDLWRRRWPAPQVVEQLPQLPQSPTSQSLALQPSSLQPLVCMSSSGHALPPCSGKRWICRCLCCWPPPHVFSQVSHSLHSEVMQSKGDCPQVLVSSNSPVQGVPPLATLTT
mmetsp:Transcript_73050/g.236304  ORF Transcript_73050/g.236304 Transcript_73050/m.236304 type:complete len:515 (+) Transcript_73050:223-1767(+)